MLILVAASADFWVWWRGSSAIVNLEEMAAPDIILVPGASVLRNGRPSPVLRQRIETAVGAARLWPLAKMVLSGSGIAGGYDEPGAMRRYLIEHGIDSTRLVLDRKGRNTRASITNLGVPEGRLVVVSQRWHLARAIWLAKIQGWPVEGLVAGSGTSAGWENLVREHFVRIQNFWGLVVD